MNNELIGITREHAMRLAADLEISGSTEHVVELLWCAQWSVLISILSVPEARRIMAGQDALAA